MSTVTVSTLEVDSLENVAHKFPAELQPPVHGLGVWVLATQHLFQEDLDKLNKAVHQLAEA